MANLLADFDDLTPEQRSTATANLHDSAKNLFALLENLLTWSRVQHGLLEYVPQETPLVAFAERNINLFTPLAEEKHLHFRHTLQHDLVVNVDVM